MREIFLGMLGLCMGTTIASGVVAFIISLGIVPRFAGITGSAAQVRLYEECSMLGAVPVSYTHLEKPAGTGIF